VLAEPPRELLLFVGRVVVRRQKKPAYGHVAVIEEFMRTRYKPSNYNHAITYKDKVLVFNGVSSALVMLDRDAYERLRPYLFGRSGAGLENSDRACTRFRPPLLGAEAEPFEIEGLDDRTLQRTLHDLLRAQYIVEESVDELEYLRRRYRDRQHNDPLLVMVTTTMDCNLGCYYCYEDKHPTYLSNEICDGIFEHIRKDLQQRDQKRMHLSWYGGEPMLNQEAITYLSAKVIGYCDESGARYTASMVSNGTVWPRDPEDAVRFVSGNRIGSIQFSFDGLPDNHNKRRHYVDGNRNHAVSSFDALCSTVDAIRGHARIYLRLNLDRGNQADAYRLVDYFHERGWLYPGSKVFPYLAPLGPYTDVCRSVEKTAINLTDYDLMNNDFRRYLSKYADIREFGWGYYPRSLQLNCSAVASHSVIFGPDGAMYKCPHDLGVRTNSHGHVAYRPDNGANLFPILANASASNGHKPHNDYPAYDRFSKEPCSQCRYLPTCLGGCPKVQMEQQAYYLDSVCHHWENSFEAMIRTYADSMSGDIHAPFRASSEELREEPAAFGI
jgi:uncharacterized protein